MLIEKPRAEPSAYPACRPRSVATSAGCMSNRKAPPGRRWWMARVGCIAAVGLVAMAAGPLAADDWPQFRGPNASGVASTDHPLPTEFSMTDKVRWKAELGDGVASPVVSGGKVFTTAMTGDEQFAVFCFDFESGSELWHREFDTGELPRITPPNSHASSTPACDGQRLYVYFSTLGILALDVEDGRTIWGYQLPLPAYLMDWGAAASPIVFENTVYFNQDDDLAPALFAIAADTGELRWRVNRPEMLAGYAVPVLCEVDGRTELVIAGSGKMIGYDPATGKQLWYCRTLPRTIMTSPVVRGDTIYVAVQSYGDESRTLKYALLEWLDTNQDGVLERSEVPKEFWERFDESDKDGDGKLSEEELDTAFQSADNLVGGGSIIQAIRAGGRGDVTKTRLVWGLENRSPSNLSSPLLVGDQLFVVKKGGLSSSFDAATGEAHWTLKRIQNLGDYYGSPVSGDGKIYVVGENGFLVVLAQKPELEVLARNDMGESCVATPALAQGNIFIRTRHHLYCIGNE
jgi:outer membrane protein assembly factor BamB